ncbi:hypothetical protein ACIRYZ_32505 [Kitasatospora sp. NPDC101155]|uniref:hypothetical protein n=1 Tax=Kitasatospora sp. NPDC101155 TaxID=3364097 RepID=UPI0037F6F259
MIPFIGQTGYIGLTAFVLNLLVALALTVLLRALGAPQGKDETSPEDYRAEAAEEAAGAPESAPAPALTAAS